MVQSSRVPVDHGWAWCVLAGAIFNHFTIMCVAKSSGVLFAALIEEYDAPALLASVMQALFGGITFFGAPAFTAFGDACTIRVVTLCGAGFMFAAGVVSSFGRDIYSVVLPFGILGGTGVGLAVSNAPIMVSRYFEGRRALANGLLFSGSGVASILGPPVVQLAIKIYGMPQVFLLIGAFMLQVAIGASLYRPMSFWVRNSKPHADEIDANDNLSPEKDKLEGQAVYVRAKSECASGMPEAATRQMSLPRGGVTESQAEESHSSLLQKSNGRSASTPGWSIQKDCEDTAAHAHKLPCVSTSDIFMESLLDLPPEVVRDARSAEQIAQRQEQWWRPRLLWQYLWQGAGNMLGPVCNVSVLRDPAIWLFNAACAMSCAGFFIGMVTPPRCLELGMSAGQVRALLMVIGVSESVGRIAVALVADWRHVRRRHAEVMAALLAACGVTTCCVAMQRTFVAQVVYLSLAPAFWGGGIALHVTLLTDLCGPKDLPSAFGLLMFVEGVVVMLDPLLIGAQRDRFGSYVSGYLFLSVQFFVSAVLLCALAYVLRRRRRDAQLLSHSEPQCG